MKAEIISIGTELLLGQIVDTNSRYIAEKLTEFGYDIHYIKTVGDNFKRIVSSFKKAEKRADLIITTGGLGPTKDDLTRKALAEAVNKDLYLNRELKEDIEEYFAEHNYNITKNNYRQAYIPKEADSIPNENGTAPGIIYENKNSLFICLPGVPLEMKNMMENMVIPLLKRRSDDFIYSRTLNLFGIGESSLETKIADILKNQDNPTLALLAGKGEVSIRITAKGRNKNELKDKVKKKEREIRDQVGRYIYGIDDSSLPSVAGEHLNNKGLTLAVAESCTGGLLGHRLTQIPGSSNYFNGGAVVYSNNSKVNLLGVDEILLKKKGAVSRGVAGEMAEGVSDKYNSDIGIGITGIAGPGGGTPEKPVGLIYIAIKMVEKESVWQLNLKGDRKYNKWMSSQYALFYLLKLLRKI